MHVQLTAKWARVQIVYQYIGAKSVILYMCPFVLGSIYNTSECLHQLPLVIETVGRYIKITRTKNVQSQTVVERSIVLYCIVLYCIVLS